jgi:hypothetical protein
MANNYIAREADCRIFDARLKQAMPVSVTETQIHAQFPHCPRGLIPRGRFVRRV